MARALLAVAACAMVQFGCSCDDTHSGDTTGGAAGAAGSSSPASTGGAQPSGGATSGGGGAYHSTGSTGGDSASGGRGPTGGDPAAGGGSSGEDAGGTGATATGGSGDVPGLGGNDAELGGSAGAVGQGAMAGAPPSAAAAGMAGFAQGGAGAAPDGAGGALSSGGTTGMGVAGTDAAAGAAGSSGVSCDRLCAAEGCTTAEPACFAEAFGLTSGEVIPICLPSGAAGAYAYCEATSCAETGTPGCALLVQIGTVDWQLEPTTAGASSNVVLSATVTRIEGTIAVTGGASCDLTVDIAEATPLPVVANGALEPVAAAEQTQRLGFTSTDVDTTAATVRSEQSTPACNTLAGMAFALAGTQMEAALRDALNSMADPLTCLACRADCPQKVACVGQ